jgi:uncharacterized protein (TIGR00297 family)
MEFSYWQLIIGFILAVLIALISFQLRFLNRSGVIAAILLGFVVFGFGGLSWAIVLLGFFISSSGLSKILNRRKKDLSEKFSKGSNRDAEQVLANGGIAGVFVLFHLFFPHAVWPWLAFAGTFAAVNADTWGTELGVLSSMPPVSLKTGKKVEIGTSGGVSLAGTIAAISGSFLIAGLAVIFWPNSIPNPMAGSFWLPLAGITMAGLFGSLIDSFLGATVQVIYYCPKCKKDTERSPEHLCGTKTVYLRGWNWLNNDWVNLICGLSGGLAMILSLLK